MNTLVEKLSEVLETCCQGNLEQVSEFLMQEMDVSALKSDPVARKLYHRILDEFEEQRGEQTLDLNTLDWTSMSDEDISPFDFKFLQSQKEPSPHTPVYQDFLDKLRHEFLRRNPEGMPEDFYDEIYSVKEGHLWFLDHYGIGIKNFNVEDAYEAFFEHQEQLRSQVSEDNTTSIPVYSFGGS